MEELIAWLLSFTIQEVAALTVIFGALAAMSRRVRAKVKQGYTKLFPTRNMLKQHIADEDELLRKILAELKPNDSSSLRDAIDRIEHKMGGLEAFTSAQLNVHTIAIVRTDEKGRLIYANRFYQRILGVSAAEVMGEGWINVIHPSEREKIKRLWQEAVTSRREFNEDITFITSKGVSLKGHANVYKEIDAKGNIRGYLGVITFPSECNYQATCLEQMIELFGEGYESDPSKRKV